MDQLSMSEKIGANYMLLELSGALNAYTMNVFEEKLYSYILESNTVVDLSLVTGIDSAAMGVLMAGFNDGIEFGNKLFFLNPSENARKAIDKTGFTDVFYIIHSVTEVSDDSVS